MAKNLRGWDIRHAILRGANITGADLRRTKVNSSELIKAIGWKDARLDLSTLKAAEVAADLSAGEEQWRFLADEARAKANGMTDPVSRRTMLDIASSYDTLAERAKQRKGQSEGETASLSSDPKDLPQMRPDFASLGKSDTNRWRSLAGEARALADSMTNAETTRVMLLVADGYDLLADRALMREKSK